MGAGALAVRGLVLLAILGLAALGVAPMLTRPPVADLSWLLHVADRVLHGARYGVDVVETNPPLIVWLKMPAVLLARAAAIRPITAFAGELLVIAGGAGLLASRLHRHLRPRPFDRSGLVLLFAVAAAVLVVPEAEFGQREHVAVMLVIPYLVVLAARLEGAVPGPGEAILAGLLAAIGLGLKPHFVVVALALLGMMARAQGVRLTLRRPESLALIGASAAHPLLITMLAPGYWGLAGALPVYLDYFGDRPLLRLLLFPGAPVFVFAPVAAAALGTARGNRSALVPVLVVAVLGFVVAAVLQLKGWSYHFLPARSLGAALLVAALTDADRVRRPMAAPTYVLVSALVVGALAFGSVRRVVDQLRQGRDVRWGPAYGYWQLRRVLEAEPPGSGVLVLSTNLWSSFPLVTDAGLSWSFRYWGLWVLAGVHWDQVMSGGIVTPPSRPGPQERAVVDALAADLAHNRPGLLIVMRPDTNQVRWGGARQFDYIGYLGASPPVRAEFDRYDYVEDVTTYRVFRRVREGASALRPPAPIAPDPPACHYRGPEGGWTTGDMAFGLLAGLVVLTGWTRRQRRAFGSAT